jgi:choline dehydrogenase-like flavoprotein
LRSVGIPVRIDLPGVGENLADHPAVSIECGYRGPVRTAPVLHSITTFHSSGRSSDETPGLMFWLSEPGRSSDDMTLFEIEVVLLRPRGRGTVRLRSADPADAPRVELPNFRDTFDVERLAEGYDRALDVTRSPELRSPCAETPVPISERSRPMPRSRRRASRAPSPGSAAAPARSGRDPAARCRGRVVRTAPGTYPG